MKSPREKYITIYGRKPVFEALDDFSLNVEKLLIAENSQGDLIKDIVKKAKSRNIEIRYESKKYIGFISKNGRQDQGVVLDVIAPNLDWLASYLENNKLNNQKYFALDGVKNSANIGMIIRSAIAFGIDGIILPLKSSPNLNPLVIKASAGTAFKARVLKCKTISSGLELLKKSGFEIFGLDGEAEKNVFETKFSGNQVFVFGDETAGITCNKYIDKWLKIPMENGIESLNVACASTVLGYEILRNRLKN